MHTQTHPRSLSSQRRSKTILLLVLLLLLPAAAGWLGWKMQHRPRNPAPDPAALHHQAPGANTPPAAQVSVPGAAGDTHGRAGAKPPALPPGVATPPQGPSWAIAYGAEFWRANPSPATTTGINSNPAPALNVAEVVERVTHAFRREDSGISPRAQGLTYSARFEPGGDLEFSPHRPPALLSAKPQPDPDTEAWFRTMAMTRGGETLFVAGDREAKSSLVGNTAQVLLNEPLGIVTHYEARAQGVDVTWVLPKPPAGEGALVVESELAGVRYAGRTENGLHFADASGVARVRIGNVTAVDAGGGRWTLAMSATGNRLRVEVPAEILSQANYPLAIDPALEAEFEMDKRLFVPDDGYQTAPAVAATSGGYLVVWQGSAMGMDSCIFGTRVSTAGLALDPAGIEISPESGQGINFASDPAVAASGTGYLVAWRVVRNSGSDIYAARVTTAGVVSDRAGIPICRAGGDQTKPAVAGSAAGYLVVWEDARDGNRDIYGTRVTRTGLVSDPDGAPICIGADHQSAPKVASSGSSYLVVWEDRRNVIAYIYASVVATTGPLVQPGVLSISSTSTDSTEPSVAGNAAGYLVVWTDARNSNPDIYAARVKPTGELVDPTGFPICSEASEQTAPRVTATSGGFLAVWQDKRQYGAHGIDLYGAHISASAVVAEPDGYVFSQTAGDQTGPSLAGGASGVLLAWSDARFGSPNIHSMLVPTTGQRGAETVLSTAVNKQSTPAVAAGVGGYLVVWQDQRNGDDIYGARVTSSGVVSDPLGIAICTETNLQAAPSVAANSYGYIVAWQDARNGDYDIYATLVYAFDGSLGTPGGQIISATNGVQGAPCVAASPSGFFIAWNDQRSGRYDIYGARMSFGTALTETNIPISTATGDKFNPSAAWSENNFLVAWQDDRHGHSDIYGARIRESDGAVLDPSGILISTNLYAQNSPKVAGGTDEFLVAWGDYRNGSSDIYGARVQSSNGSVLDPDSIPICTDGGEQYSESNTSTGDSFIVTWRDLDRGLAWRRLNPAGQLLGATASLVNGSYGRYFGAAAYGGGGRFLLASGSERRGLQRIVASLNSTDRPAAGPVLQFKSANFTVLEDQGLATITVTATGINPGAVAVRYSTIDGTGEARRGDYQETSGLLVFHKGTTQQTFTIPVSTNSTHQPNRTVNLLLSAPQGGATLGLKYRAVLTIQDDDAGGELNFAAPAYSVRESTHSILITVRRTGGTAGGVTVFLETGGGTAVAGTDYMPQTGQLYFEAGQTTTSFSIPILDNLVAEGNKTFFVNLWNPAGGATVGRIPSTTVTILEDD